MFNKATIPLLYCNTPVTDVSLLFTVQEGELGGNYSVFIKTEQYRQN